MNINFRKITALLLFIAFFTVRAQAQCWKSLYTGFGHTVALRSDGIWAWGWNKYGQLGDGTDKDRTTPVQISSDTSWKVISADFHTVLALKTDGSLWAWGRNDNGQLGDGTLINRYLPIRIGTNNNWKSVSAGAGHSLAIKTDGTLWAWGINNAGQLGNGTNISSKVPIQIGTDTDWKSIEAGQLSSLAQKTNGTLWSWGFNNTGILGHGTNKDTNNPVQIGVDNNWKSYSLSGGHVIALKTDGSLWAWGANYASQLGDGTTLPKNAPVQIGKDTNWESALTGVGSPQSFAIKTDGSLWSWGYNYYGQLGNGPGGIQSNPVQVGSDKNWKNVITGNEHVIALKTDGSLWVWGNNQYGQLGDGTNNVYYYPTKNAPCPLSAITDISNSNIHIFPNPTTGFLQLEGVAAERVEIYDYLGRLQMSFQQPQAGFDLSAAPAGLYIVRIYSEGKQYSARVVKE